MDLFLERPSLPARRVVCCALSCDAVEEARALRALDIQVLAVPPDDRLPAPVRSHADLQLCDLGQGSVVCNLSNAPLIRALQARGLRVVPSERPPGDSFPRDAGCDALLFGGALLAREDACDPAILEACRRQGIALKPVRQGYTRCCAAPCAPNALMTPDRGIAAAASSLGADVLLLEPGGIELPGYAEGFIGGCCGLIAPDTLAFAGDLETYPQKAAVRAFLQKHGVVPLSLSRHPLRDIGGILPLMCSGRDLEK